MTTRQLTLHQVTRMAITIVVEDDTGVLTFSVLVVTGMLAACGQVGRWGFSILRDLKVFMIDVGDAVLFTYKVLSIGVVSFAYGLGLMR